MKVLVLLIAYALWGCAVCADQPSGRDGEVRFNGTRAYDAKVATLALSPEAALRRLRAAAAAGALPDGKYFLSAPVFVVGDVYHFQDAEKNRILLEGFYVDGNTGRIEFRASDKTLERGETRIPDDAFQSIEVISPHAEPSPSVGSQQ